MYLWKVDKLVEDFKADKVSQKEELKYMLFFTVYITAILGPYLYIGSSSSDIEYCLYDHIMFIADLAIPVYGTYFCYKLNSAGDNKNFFVRFSCISLPVTIRANTAIVILICLSFFIYVVLTGVSVNEVITHFFVETSIYTLIVWTMYLVLYYWYLSIKMKDVSS